jgi:hypothetical protein
MANSLQIQANRRGRTALNRTPCRRDGGSNYMSLRTAPGMTADRHLTVIASRLLANYCLIFNILSVHNMVANEFAFGCHFRSWRFELYELRTSSPEADLHLTVTARRLPTNYSLIFNILSPIRGSQETLRLTVTPIRKAVTAFAQIHQSRARRDQTRLGLVKPRSPRDFHRSIPNLDEFVQIR